MRSSHPPPSLRNCNEQRRRRRARQAFWARKTRRSGLAGGLEHRRVERFARALAGPDDILEGREVALAGVERGAEQSLALGIGGIDAARQHQRMSEHDNAVLWPQVEMPDPHLLVHQRDELLNFAASRLGHLEIEGAGEV